VRRGPFLTCPSWAQEVDVRATNLHTACSLQGQKWSFSIRILIVDDFDDWRRQLHSLLKAQPTWQIIAEASNGSEAVQKAEDLKPDLILLDIGLPKLNGIEAARQIRQRSPSSKIIFLSQNSDLDIVRAAFDTGASGYVRKIDAGRELLPAVDAVLGGKQFVSSGLKGDEFTDASVERAPHRHEVLFYSDDTVFLDSCTRFIAAALGAGNVAAVVATESHRDSLFQRLKAEGLDIDAEIKQGRYISLDVDKTLSTFMVNDLPDWERFFEVVGGLVGGAAKAGKGEQSRVAMWGECGPLLWAEGKVDAAIQLEQLLNQLGTIYEFDLLCAYALRGFHGGENEHAFESICAQHSAVYSQ
jgi:DNA-binding NarL/FixJ family response regulator